MVTTYLQTVPRYWELSQVDAAASPVGLASPARLVVAEMKTLLLWQQRRLSVLLRQSVQLAMLSTDA
jgi:hypothetical protein